MDGIANDGHTRTRKHTHRHTHTYTYTHMYTHTDTQTPPPPPLLLTRVRCGLWKHQVKACSSCSHLCPPWCRTSRPPPESSPAHTHTCSCRPSSHTPGHICSGSGWSTRRCLQRDNMIDTLLGFVIQSLSYMFLNNWKRVILSI